MTIDAIPDFTTPVTRNRIREVRLVREPLRLLLKAPAMARQQRGDGRPVVVIPGFGTSDAATFVVRGYLSRLGYECSGWGLGVNNGEVEQQLDQTLTSLHARFDGQPIALVAWSLGGVIARECARDAPGIIERVITFGTPLYGPRHTSTTMARRSPRRDEIEAQIIERSTRPIERPVTAIYSRNDGVVAWEACVDPDPNTVNVEVTSSHFGLGLDPDVLGVVAETLGDTAP